MDTTPPAPQPGGAPAPGSYPGPDAGGPAPEPGPYGPWAAPRRDAPNTDRFFGGIRRTGLTRGDDRWVAGVCTGIAQRFDLDPLVVRALFAVSVLLGGLGLVVYGIAWALLPEQKDGRIHLEQMILGNFDVALLGALAMVLVGFGRGDRWFWFWPGPPGWLQAIAWLALVGVVIALVVNRRPSAPRTGYAAPYAPPPGAPGPVAQPSPTTQGAPVSTPYPYASAAAAPAAPTATSPVYGPAAPYGPAPAYGPAPVARPAGGGPAVPPSGPTHQGSAWQPAPSKPPKPPRRRPKGPGVAMVGSVVALSLIALAILLLAERSGDFDGPVLLSALGIGVVLCGLGIIVSGLRGRTSGTLGFLAIVGTLVALPVGAAVNAGPWWWEDGHRAAVSDDYLTVTDREAAARGFDMGLGDATLDLRSLPMTSTTLDVPVSLGAGNLTILVPSDAAVSADVQLGAGSVRWDVDGDQRQAGGVAMGTRSFTDDQTDTGPAQLHLEVGVGAGEVRIQEEQ